MANNLPPPSLEYDAGPTRAGEYYSAYPDTVYQASDGLYYYASQEQSSTSSYTSAHDASAITVVSHQEPSAHQYYGDAVPAVISYPNSYVGQSGDAWMQPKSVQSQHFYPGSARPEAVFYDSGDASPASDDSNAAYYDSPISEGSNLMDDYPSRSHSNGQTYYPHAQAVHPAQGVTVDKDNYPRHRMSSDDGAGYEENALHFSSAPHAQYASLPNYPAAYYAEGSPVDDGFTRSQGYSDTVASPVHAERCSSTYFVDAPYPQNEGEGHSARAPGRGQSPMAHLPYHNPDYQQHQRPQPHVSLPNFTSSGSSPFTHAPQATRPILSVQQPQPHYPQTQAAPPTPISIPSHSPPLIEDTPKKPLTLACFFCRKRKIACGSPPPGSQDRTCK
ncbi:hypothetical protein EIP86_001682 [Pleurotus ostreatoroseus]|nr:hypothetical protein EIP86_001682 [Pleurotus ostreatoroseus]